MFTSGGGRYKKEKLAEIVYLMLGVFTALNCAVILMNHIRLRSPGYIYLQYNLVIRRDYFILFFLETRVFMLWRYFCFLGEYSSTVGVRGWRKSSQSSFIHKGPKVH